MKIFAYRSSISIHGVARHILYLSILISCFSASPHGVMATSHKNYPEQRQKKALYERNRDARSLSFTYLTGIIPEGKNPRRFDLPQKDLLILDGLAKDYAKALPTLFPKNEKESAEIFQHKKKHARRIPKKLHFIWIGPKPFPESSIENVESWRNKHPDWEMIFWTDSASRPLPIPQMKRQLITEYSFDRLSPFIPKTTNWGEKSDLMRYVILSKEGGVYVDHDVVCYQSFDTLCHFFDFIVALERPHYHASIDTFVLPANSIIASRPKHPILDKTMEKIEEIWEKVEEKFPLDTPGTDTDRVLARTFDSFAISALQYRLYNHLRKDLILPSSYFYSIKVFKHPIRKQLRKKNILFAAHTYQGEWKDPKPDSKKGLPHHRKKDKPRVDYRSV